MHLIARHILQTYIFEKKIPTPDELRIEATNLTTKTIPIFVTLYDHDDVIASSGRLFPTKNTTIEELIDITIQAATDPRFMPYTENPERSKNVRFRVDTFTNNDRRLLHHPDDINPAEEGMIVVCQKQDKIGVILPHMVAGNISGEDLYHLLIKKTGIDIHTLGKGDMIIYGLKTTVSEG